MGFQGPAEGRLVGSSAVALPDLFNLILFKKKDLFNLINGGGRLISPASLNR